MTKDSAEKQQNTVGRHPITQADGKKRAEQRRIEDALEDDEVREALVLQRTRGKNQATT